uniref:Putative extracellular protein CSOL_001 n=1 Tax=Pseudococcomyxa simplex TaxID=464287 RepID=A0A7L9QDP9_9CHLO|nr:putative extracellular protein CSOL_001 [Pseudococcomyxa simplex]
MGLKICGIVSSAFLGLLIAVSSPFSIDAQPLDSTPFIPTQTLVQTSLPIITLENCVSPVTFTAIVSSTSAAQPLGPSSGTVTFTISGSDAFKWVRPTELGTGPLSRVSVSGVAKLQMQHATEGITLLPGTYNVTAKFSGSSDGLFRPSQGSTTFRISITSPPVVWGL